MLNPIGSELFLVTVSAVVAFVISLGARRGSTKKAAVIAITISVGLFLADRVIWATTRSGIIDHVTCWLAPASIACSENGRSSPPAPSAEPRPSPPPQTAEPVYSMSDILPGQWVMTQSVFNLEPPSRDCSRARTFAIADGRFSIIYSDGSRRSQRIIRIDRDTMQLSDDSYLNRPAGSSNAAADPRDWGTYFWRKVNRRRVQFVRDDGQIARVYERCPLTAP